MAKITFKNAFREIHLWLGLTAGITMFISCITGTLYVFRPDIQDFLSKDKYLIFENITKKNNILPIDSVQKKVERHFNKKMVSFERYQQRNKADKIGIQFEELRKNNKGKEVLRKTTKSFYFNKYTGEVMEPTDRVWNEFFRFTLRMHRWLMYRPAGRIIIGISTIIFTFMLITGIVLWFPKKYKKWKYYKKRLIIRTNKGFKKLNFDLHNTLGFYSMVFLLVMCLTGITWSFDWYYNAYHYILAGRTKETRKKENKHFDSTLKKNTQYGKENNLEVLPLCYFAKKLNEKYPNQGDWSISKRTTRRGKHPYISASKTGNYNWIHYKDRLYFDAYKGEIIQERTLKGKSIGQQISILTYAIHIGDVFGGSTRFIYFLACIIGSSLPITGTIHWLKKRKKKTRKKKK